MTTDAASAGPSRCAVAFGQVLKEAQVAAGGGVAGINHVAHLSGAGAGVLLVVAVRALITLMEGSK